MEDFSPKAMWKKPIRDEYCVLTTVSLLAGGSISGKMELRNICSCNANIWQCNLSTFCFVREDVKAVYVHTWLSERTDIPTLYSFHFFPELLPNHKPYSTKLGLKNSVIRYITVFLGW